MRLENYGLEVVHVSGLNLNFACQLTSHVRGLKSHVSQASCSINHGLEAVHVSGLKFACQLTSNVGGLECSQALLNRDQPLMSSVYSNCLYLWEASSS